jgi:putative inorganic carbon (hco3(-)) transporter
MRDYLILGFILGSLPVCFLCPFWGVLMWTWVSLMNPHRLTWGIAYNFPVAQCVALAVLLGVPFARGKRHFPIVPESVLCVLLWILFTASSAFAFYPDQAWPEWQQVSKILLMAVLPTLVVTDRKKLKYLLWTIALSIGFYGAKGGLFSLATAGAYRVWGPRESFIEDNNDLALALNMVLPILFYLAREESRRYLKIVLYGVLGFSVLAVLFTYSRGGLLGLAVITFVYLLKAKRKTIAFALLLIIIPTVIAFAPGQWLDRMGSIRDYSEGSTLDDSSSGRINAWKFAWNLALDRPLTGGGFQTFSPELFLQYAPDPKAFHDAHSIYFEMLGEQGFVGLALFLALLLSCFRSLSRLKRNARDFNLPWLTPYADMMQLSLIAYMVGGAFLGRAYFDLFYQLVIVIVVIKQQAREELDALIQAGDGQINDDRGVDLQEFPQTAAP